MSQRIVAGIDIGKQSLYYCFLSSEGELIVQGNVDNTQDGFEKLFDLIQTHQAEVMFEATGVYSRRWQYFLELNDYSYIRMNPLRAKKEMDTLRNTKNDKIDAKKLAILQMQKKYDPTYVEDSVYRELRRRSRFYNEITQECANDKNRVQKLLEETFCTLAQTMDASHLRFYEVAAVLPHVQIVKDSSEEELLERLSVISGYEATKVKLIKKLKAVSVHTAVAADVDSYAVTELMYWANRVLELTSLKEKVISEMMDESKDLEEVELLETIPGIAASTAVTLVAELGDIRRFKTPQKLNAFVGIDIRFGDSGQVKTSGCITKRGNGFARKQLYQMFIHIIGADRKHELELTRWYYRRTENMTRGKKKIIVGGMDRILRLMHHMVVNQETFDRAEAML